jgi:hypothetical protein
LDPHDLVVPKYVARRDKDRAFNQGLVSRGLVDRERLLALVDRTLVDSETRERMRTDIVQDFRQVGGRSGRAASGTRSPKR